jgi:hypothetical protein
MIAVDGEFAARLAAATERYRAERDALVPDTHTGPVPTGGIGGVRAGVKCLHAHYADTAAGNDNPVGDWVAGQIEPLDCSVPCVVEVDGTVRRNPDWVEPR